MRWLTNAVLTVALLVGAIGCGKSVDPKVKSFTYPLAMGNQWVYEEQMITDYRGKKPNDTLTYSITATVIGIDTILPGIYSYTIRATSTTPEEKGGPWEARYLNLPDGMYRFHAQSGSGAALPKQLANGPMVMFRGQQYQNVQTLLTSLIGPPSPDAAGLMGSVDSFTLVLPYPQSLGQHWISSVADDDHPTGVEKEIIDAETIKNSTGSFDCHVIRWIYDPPIEDFEFEDFISAEGLIQRRMEMRNLIMTDYQYPYGNGDTADMVSTYELTSFELH